MLLPTNNTPLLAVENIYIQQAVIVFCYSTLFNVVLLRMPLTS